MANSVKINVDVVTNITGQDDVKKLQESLNALNSANASRAKSEKAASASKQRSIIQIAEEIAAENKKRQIQIDAYNASIAAYIKEASSLSNITRLIQHKASIELAAAKQEKSLADETQKAQKYAYNFTAIEVKMGIDGAKARAKAEKEAAAARAKAEKEAAAAQDKAAKAAEKAAKEAERAEKEAAKEAEKASKAKIRAEKEAAKEAEKASKAEIRAEKEAAKEAEKAYKAEMKQEQQLKKMSDQRLSSAASSASYLVSKTQSSFSRIKDIALGTLAGLGLDELFSSIGEKLLTATSNASSIVESENLLRATYNEGADALLNWADKNAEAYGLANASAKQYLSFLTGVLNNTDISSDKLGSMAQNYTRLVGDMASAYNTEIDDAFQAIRSGIAGNTLAMQRYGIVLSVTNLQQYLQSKGIETTYRSLDAASKQYVRYAYIMEHTSEIQGDYTRTFESFANSVKTLKNEWNNFLSLLGQYAIPVLMPIINALRTAIAYAGAILKYLAEIYGWEQYTTIAVDYSYQQVENIEDAVDSQEDLTKEVNNTNKALKSGVKLLDLYSLDFSDASDASSAGTTPEKIPVSAQLEDLANIDYNVPESILPEINIDPAKVKAIGDTIAGIINGVGVFIEGVKTWLDKPLPNKLIDIGGLVGGLFAWNLIKPKLSELPGKIGAWISKTWKDPLKGPILKVFTGLGSVALAGIGGWNLGSVLYGIFEEGVVDIPGLISGVLLTVGGLIGAFAAGPVVGVAAAITAALAGGIAYIYEIDKSAEEAVGNVMSGTRSLVDYINEQPAHESIQTFSSEISGLSSTADGLKESMLTAIGEAGNFDTAVTTLPEGQTSAEFMTEKYNNLTTSVKNYIETVKTPVDSALLDSLTGPNGLLEGADALAKKLEDSLSSIREIQKADIAGYREELSELSAKKASGTITDDELERMSFIIEQLKILGGISGELATAKFDIDLTTLGESLNVVKLDVETNYADYAKAKEQYEDDVAYFTRAIEGLDKTSASYQEDLKRYTDALERSKATLDVAEGQLRNNLTSISEAAEKGYYAAQKQFYADALPAAANYLVKLPTKDIWINAYKDAFGDAGWRDVVDAPDDITIRQYAEVDLELPKEELAAMTDEQLEDLLFASREMQLLVAGKVSTEEMYYITNKGKKAATLVGGFYEDFRDKMLNTLGDSSNAYVDEDWSVKFKDLDLYVDMGIKPGDILTDEDKNALFNEINSLPEVIEPSTEKAGDEIGDNLTDSASESITSEESTEKMTSAVEEGLTSALENVETPEEAKTKGSDLAESITSGVTSGFNTALAPGSEFMKAADNLTNTLVNIPTKFETAFKSAVNNVAGYINSLVNGLKQQLEGLNLPEGELTVAQLYNSLKDSNFKIPMLANGGVIPANNPFLAVLGDQKSGVNVEAPVTVIQEAVRNVVNDPGTSDNIEVKVYIGDREIRDFVIDTVTANNLVVG